MGWYQAVSFPLSLLVSKDVSLVTSCLTSSQLSHSWVLVGIQTGGNHVGHLPYFTPIKLLVGLLQDNQIYSCERDWGTMRGWSPHEIYWTNERTSSFASAQTHPIQCWCNCLRAPNVQEGGDLTQLNTRLNFRVISHYSTLVSMSNWTTNRWLAGMGWGSTCTCIVYVSHCYMFTEKVWAFSYSDFQPSKGIFSWEVCIYFCHESSIT